jgi:hypothetical protein
MGITPRTIGSSSYTVLSGIVEQAFIQVAADGNVQPGMESVRRHSTTRHRRPPVVLASTARDDEHE